uniref:Uncharacterized protein n=1 Tax=Globisporangium ultimum (strain ATCC 200006 / CBS 805.95 / DAOM BR144) TaxID=431595 RepID=K3WZV1_GLOUD
MLLSRVRIVGAVAACATSRATTKLCVVRATTRSLSSEPKRPKAIKVKKGEARRRVEPKPEPNALAEQPHDALTEVPQAQPPSPFVHSQQEPPQTFGQVMKMNFFWGIGMALAFSFVGVIFSRMEETAEPGKFDDSSVLVADTTDDK